MEEQDLYRNLSIAFKNQLQEKEYKEFASFILSQK
jgi:hypothetical protein